MKKILTAILLISLVAAMLVSCDGGADITLPPEESTTAITEVSAYSFIYKNTTVTPHTKMSELVNGLGIPTTYEESPSCLYRGLDKDYTYPGFKLRTYPLNGVDYVLNVCFVDDSVETPEGIMLGSTRDEVIAAYGTSFVEENGNTIYRLDDAELRFRFSDNGVTAIEYWAITD